MRGDIDMASSGNWWGAFLVLLGGWWLLAELDLVSFSWDYVGPIAIIIVGIIMLLGRSCWPDACMPRWGGDRDEERDRS